MLRRSGTDEAARALYLPLVRRLRRDDFTSVGLELSRGFLDLGDPASALRCLRRSRYRRVRRWEDESRDRLEVAARAHEALCRDRTALRLYRMITPRHRSEETQKKIATLAARLGESTDGEGEAGAARV